MRPLTILLLFALTMPASAITGNDYLSNMAGEERHLNAMTEGYLYGIANQYAFFGGGGSCPNLPDGVTVAQKQKIVERFIADHPDKTHLRLAVLVVMALDEAFGTVPFDEDGFCP